MSTPVIASLLVILSAHVARKTPTPSLTPTYTTTSTVVLTATPTVTLTPSNTPTSTATATPTILDTATIAPTPTSTATPASLVCPANGATLVIQVDNESGVPQQVTFTGNVLTPSCFGGVGGYSSTTTCGVGVTDCLTLTGLSSGIWKHQISAGLQNQATKSILLAADPNGVANSVSWVVFRSVLTVDRTDDVSSNPIPQCPSAPGMQTCTLRKAMAAGGSAAAPLLIQFDPQVFPAGTPTMIQLTQTGRLPIAGYQMTIDGTDLNGSPTFSDDAHNRVVQLPSTGGTFVFSNERARLIGLFLQRPPLVDGATPGDLVRFDGTVGVSSNNIVANCRIDGGGGSLTMKSTAHDCVEGFGSAGADWGSANRIQNTELTGCPDKAAKVTTLAHLVVQDSWIHHNIGGGLQATFSGNLEADRNLVEFNGYNSTAQVFMNANGLSANGANNTLQPISPSIPSVLQTNGNIIRNNSLRGISAQELSAATITNDLSCGALNGGTAGQNGIAIFNSTYRRRLRHGSGYDSGLQRPQRCNRCQSVNDRSWPRCSRWWQQRVHAERDECEPGWPQRGRFEHTNERPSGGQPVAALLRRSVTPVGNVRRQSCARFQRRRRRERAAAISRRRDHGAARRATLRSDQGQGSRCGTHHRQRIRYD